MKKYYRYSPRNFSNEYELYYTECPEDDEYIATIKHQCDMSPNSSLERATMADAIRMAARDNKYILPAAGIDEDIYNIAAGLSHRYYIEKRIVKRG